MHQQSWQDLWNLFLAIMASEPIHVRVVIGMTLTFLGVMSLTGITDSFMPKRAARRYAMMYDLMPAIVPPQPTLQFVAAPIETPAPAAETVEMAEEDLVPAAATSQPSASARRSAPSLPKVFRSRNHNAE